MPADEVAIPLDVQVRFAHACIQVLAERCRADVLHIKGPATAPGLRPQGRLSSDADVLVRPSHVDRLLRAMTGAGWRVRTSFAAGSIFEHAQNMEHDGFGLVDVHRCFPGIRLDADSAFEELWQRREVTEMAGLACTVPEVDDQRLLLLLHHARSGSAPRADGDLAGSWTNLDAPGRERLRVRAATLRAEVALAAALGELASYGEDREAELWGVLAQGGTRWQEWRARWHAAGTTRERAHVLRGLLSVNSEYLAEELGHPPTHREAGAYYLRRLGRGLHDVRDGRGKP